MENEEQEFVHSHAGLGTITVGEVRAEAVRVNSNAQITQDLVVILHRRLATVLRPSETERGGGTSFEKHSELAKLLHQAGQMQHNAIAGLQELLARLEL